MQLDDAPVVAALTGELGYDATEADVRTRFGELVTDPGHGVFVVEDGGLVAGWIHIHRAVAIQDPAWGEIVGLVVAAARHGSGVGRALVETAEAWASMRGLASVRVRSRESRRGAHRFYRSLGYELTEKSLTFERKLSA